MCFSFDARPPAPPTDLLLAPIAGGAGAELLELTSADGTRFSAALAVAPEDRGGGIVILPDVRGLYGGEDQAIPLDQVEEFDKRLDETGVEHEVHVYPGAPHSFFDRRFEQHADACDDAWRRMLAFIDKHG